MELETHTYVRRQFAIKAVQITAKNLEEVAAWCGGTVFDGCIEVSFVVAGHPQMVRAKVSDWITCSMNGTGFKCYPDKSFRTTFTDGVRDEKVFTKIHQLVLQAMSRQDVCTYHGESSQATPYAEEITRQIMKVVR